ncbi:undecaprenyl-phosphate galactose phosphotransferase WbaP [Aggregatibacter actinomycetemcomitans]|uniref:undecaprenyl-phosphate galactose phosphotransferase WbaP n=1 Tax=Aggregatibacter actinomycetemcomitans TaxID=714 RepID=UPI001E51F87F|nr:undecaprenyl-phosphate galactose phosphotransferase WbaP [Aggregatibacter actinomycetemcomitans]
MNNSAYPKINKISLVATDFFVLCFSIFIAYYFSSPDDFSWDVDKFMDSIIRLNLFLFTAFGVIAWIWTVYRHYSYRKPFWDELRDIYITIFIASFINLALFVFSQNNFSVLTWLYVWGSALILFPVFRILIKKLLRKCGTWDLNCVLIGNTENAVHGYQAISSESDLGYKVTAFVNTSNRSHTLEEMGLKLITEEQLITTINDYQKVFIALNNNQNDLIEYWVRKLARFGFRNISVIPSLRGIGLYGMEISHFFGYETVILRIQNNLAKRSSRFFKRTFDIAMSIFLLVLCLPLFGYLMIKIRRDGGRAIYVQNRIGRHGKPFPCYKFRTMQVDSEGILKELLDSDQTIRKEWSVSFKLKDDPRITEIGKFLRRTSLDELPQLWNVLRGDMSLVGPRPIVRQELKFYESDLAYYYMVRPGLSGLWQVSGRSDTDYETRVYLDSWYVKNWSLWNDIIILAKTVNVVLKGKGAY